MRQGDPDSVTFPIALDSNLVLNNGAINEVLNINRAPRSNFYTPQSVYLQPVIQRLVSELIPDADAFERVFDEFETLIAMSYLKAGGSGMPIGQFAYRGHRSMFGSGVPERLEADLSREGESWGPITGGVLDSVDEARAVLAALKEQLSRYQFL